MNFSGSSCGQNWPLVDNDGGAYPRPGESAADFTSRVRPSVLTTGDCSWIQISCPPNTPTVKRLNPNCTYSAVDIRAIIEEYRALNITNMPKGHRICAPLKAEVFRKVYSAAIAHGDTCGKWMLFVPPQHADEAWALIATAVQEGRLGDSAKISPCGGPAPPTTALICVYCADFSDRSDCLRVLKGIKQLGLKVTCAFKADALTLAGLDTAAMRPLQLNTSWQLHLDLLQEVFPNKNGSFRSGAKGYDLSSLSNCPL